MRPTSLWVVCRQRAGAHIRDRVVFYPVCGFAVAGGKYAACIMGNVGVFVEMAKADFDKTFEVLSKYI